jgi:cell division protein FtsB
VPAAAPRGEPPAAPEAEELFLDGSRGEDTREREAGRRRSSLTSRAIALTVVFLILTISYATSLRIYFAQSSDIAATKQEISQSQVKIADLQNDLSRWNNPDYVKTQARIRLGWVMPGETGFRVVGADGQPVGGGAEISSAQPAAAPKDAWWAKLWGSIEAADQPAPVKSTAKPSKQPTITEKTKPTPSASPR